MERITELQAPWEVAEQAEKYNPYRSANKDAEQAVLGSALIDPDASMQLSSLIEKDDFFFFVHQSIYTAIVSLANIGTPTDVLLLIAELERNGKLNEMGGPAYLTELMMHTPTSIYIDHYAAQVKRHAWIRRVAAAGQKIVEICYDQSLTDTEMVVALEEVQRTHLTPKTVVENVVTWEQSNNEFIDRLEAQSKNLRDKNGFDWPFPSWNEQLHEFSEGITMQILGDDGTGKTQLADIICDWWSKKRGKVGLYISTDMSRDATEKRRESRHSGILFDDLDTERMIPAQWERLMETRNDLSQWQGKIHYVYDSELDIDTACKLIATAQIHYGIEYVLLDNLNNFLDFPSSRQIKLGMNENQRGADNASRFIARIAKLGIRGIAINQLTKAGKDVSSIDDVSKQDAYGSGRQSNKVRLNLNLFRGYADKDEYAPNGELLVRKGARSRFLHYKWTKVTNGAEFKGVLLMTPELYRMNEVKMQRQPLNGEKDSR